MRLPNPFNLAGKQKVLTIEDGKSIGDVNYKYTKLKKFVMLFFAN